ncbi:MAG: hypothetical protein H0T62_03530 [Parachlamydiaceae bacterium]|nr:hypothetical protein [Parachlamydiaceae bacterium]
MEFHDVKYNTDINTNASTNVQSDNTQSEFSDSNKTQALRITKQALLAIGFITGAGAVALGLLFGPVGGIPTAVAAVIFVGLGILFGELEESSRTNDFYEFAKNSLNIREKIKYCKKAAEEGHEKAIEWEYKMGMRFVIGAKQLVGDSKKGHGSEMTKIR